MKLLRRDSPPKISFTKARERAKRLSNADLEQAVYAHLEYISAATTNWRRSGGDAGVIKQSLEDAEMNAMALVEIFRELDSRSVSAPRSTI